MKEFPLKNARIEKRVLVLPSALRTGDLCLPLGDFTMVEVAEFAVEQCPHPKLRAKCESDGTITLEAEYDTSDGWCWHSKFFRFEITPDGVQSEQPFFESFQQWLADHSLWKRTETFRALGWRGWY